MSAAQAVLLTGATGFLGSHLADTWVRAGHRVAILKRRSSRLDRIAALLDRIQCFDIEDGIEQPFKICGRFDGVVHTATCYGRGHESALEVFEANAAFPLRLLEAATHFNTYTFFNTDTILYRYMNAYSLSKSHFAEWGRVYGEGSKIRFLNIRLEHIYGPGDDASKFTTRVIRSCLANVQELRLTPGAQKRDFIHIDDVASAYTLLLEKHQSLAMTFLPFGLGFGLAVSIRDFVELVHRLADSRTELVFGALPYRDGEIMESKADIGALRALGWRPRLGLRDGLFRTIQQEKEGRT